MHFQAGRHLIIALLWLALWICPAHTFTQSGAHAFEPGRAAAGYSPVLELSSNWQSDGEGRLDAPFELSDCRLRTLTRTFTLPDSVTLPDTLFLYIEGIAWTGEVFLNDRFMFTIDGPFREHIQAIPLRLFHRHEPNTLRLVLEDSDNAYFLYPRQVCGIIRPVWLLQPSALSDPALFPELISEADTVIIFPPWLPQSGYIWNSEHYRVRLAEIRALGGRNLYFPFPPGGGLLRAAAQMGFRQVVRLDSARLVAFSHGYPMGLRPGNLPTQGWRDSEGASTDDYGRYFSLADFRSRPSQPPNRTALITLFLIPFVGLVLLRVFGQKIYQSFPQYVTKSRINFELIRDGKFLKQDQTVVMNLLQLILMSASLALLLYFIQTSGEYSRFNILSAESILHGLFAGASYSLFSYFGMAFLYLLGLAVLKYLLLSALGFVYRESDLTSGMANLEVLAAYPFNLLTFLPGAFAFFWKYEYSALMLLLWFVLLLIYFTRRIILTYAGTTYLYKLSASLKILYICTFEILPWVILI